MVRNGPERSAKPLLKARCRLRAAACGLLLGATGRGDEIAAEFADILKRRALPARDVVPKAARRKALGDCDRTAENQRRADRDDAAHAVMHRQAIVEPVGRGQAGKAGKPMAPDDEPTMTDLGGLRQTGRSRRENPQRAIGERDRTSLAFRERLAAPRQRPRDQFAARRTDRPRGSRISMSVVESGDRVRANVGAFGVRR